MKMRKKKYNRVTFLFTKFFDSSSNSVLYVVVALFHFLTDVTFIISLSKTT